MRTTLNALSKMTDDKIKAYVRKHAEQPFVGEFWLNVGRVRMFGRNLNELQSRIIRRVRHRTDISLVRYTGLHFKPKNSIFGISPNEGGVYPVRGRGRRCFFTSEEISKVSEKMHRRNANVFNGCTHFWLAYVLKVDVFHEMGRGYFYYPQKPVA